jgi:hypothetical protein
VVKNAGGYTAWSDKHPSYDFTNGPSGDGVIDLWSPEINSIPVPIPTVQGCNPLPDPGAAQSTNAWTDSFQNIRCYDQFKVQAVLNWIDGKTHDGSATAPVPNLFGMNFQAVSVGEKLVEKSLSLTGGYVDALGTPSDSLLRRDPVRGRRDRSDGFGAEKQGLLDSTLIIVSAKHGQSPIDPNRVLRIPADVLRTNHHRRSFRPLGVGPGLPVAQADEDDISMLWLTDQSQTESSWQPCRWPRMKICLGKGRFLPALRSRCNSTIRSPILGLRTSSWLRTLG